MNKKNISLTQKKIFFFLTGSFLFAITNVWGFFLFFFFSLFVFHVIPYFLNKVLQMTPFFDYMRN